MTFQERVQAQRVAQRAGFPFVGTAYIGGDDEEIYAVQVVDVEVGRSLTFVHLARLVDYIAQAVAEDVATPHAETLAGTAA